MSTSASWLLPSFFGATAPRSLHATSYLDGLRGIAAFIVFIDHFVVNYCDPLRRGYGSTSDDFYLIQLPFVRLLYSGRASVAIFFVISGFVLSHKPLKQIHAQQYASLLDTLASSIFRRGLRLYLPVAAGTLISMLMAHGGWYQELPATSTEGLPPIVRGFWNQTTDWKDHMVGISWPFQSVTPNDPYSPPYNGHLWTIPIEYYGSVVVYSMALALSRCRVGVRFVILGITTLATIHYGRWDLFLFLSGMMLAEVNVIKTLPSMTLDPSNEKQGWFEEALEFISSDDFQRWFPTINFILCIISLYLLSYPGAPYLYYDPGPGMWHYPLLFFTPARYQELWYGFERFWVSIGGVLFVLTVSNSALLQRPFTSRLAQYLGDISYSLYIVHGPVLFTFGAGFMNRFGGREGVDGYAEVFLVGCVLNTALCVWIADLFWRGVDRRCVVFAKRFAEWCWISE